MNDLSGVDPVEWVAAAKELNDRIGHTVLERVITDYQGESPIWVETHFEEDEDNPDNRVISYIEVGVAWIDANGSVDVTICPPLRRYGGVVGATVSWPGCWSQNPGDAGRFAAMLRYAANLAGSL